MSDELYKVIVEVDVFVMAPGLAEAAKVAKLHAGQEVAEFGLAHATPVKSIYEVPEDWKGTMPYSEDSHEKRNCTQIMAAGKVQDEADEVTSVNPVKKKKKRKKIHKPTENLPEKEDPNLPQLRFKI